MFFSEVRSIYKTSCEVLCGIFSLNEVTKRKFNRLTVNMKKTKYIMIGTHNMLNKLPCSHLQLQLDGIKIERVSFFEYLGIVLDDTLNMEKDVSSTFSKASYKLHLFDIIRKYSTKTASLRIFKAMGMPYLKYSFFIFSACSEKSITKLQRLQNRGLQMCLCAPSRAPIADLHRGQQ